MATILTIQAPTKRLTEDQWQAYGRYCNNGLYFDAMYKPGIHYVLDISDPGSIPMAFYKGFFKSIILKYGRGVMGYISQRTWSDKYNMYLDSDFHNGYSTFKSRGINELIQENIRNNAQPS